VCVCVCVCVYRVPRLIVCKNYTLYYTFVQSIGQIILLKSQQFS